MSVEPEMSDQKDAPNDLQREIEELREQVEAVNDSQRAYRETVIKPRLEDFKSQLDEEREAREELHGIVEEQQKQLNRLQNKMESLIGIDDSDASSPEKRVQDLKHALIRRAESRDGKASMYYAEVQDLFADLGHGEIKKPECYKAMNDAAAQDAFRMDKKTSKEGNRVKAIKLNLADLATDSGSRNSTTSEEGSVANEASKQEVNINAD